MSFFGLSNGSSNANIGVSGNDFDDGDMQDGWGDDDDFGDVSFDDNDDDNDDDDHNKGGGNNAVGTNANATTNAFSAGVSNVTAHTLFGAPPPRPPPPPPPRPAAGFGFGALNMGSIPNRDGSLMGRVASLLEQAAQPQVDPVTDAGDAEGWGDDDSLGLDDHDDHDDKDKDNEGHAAVGARMNGGHPVANGTPLSTKQVDHVTNAQKDDAIDNGNDDNGWGDDDDGLDGLLDEDANGTAAASTPVPVAAPAPTQTPAFTFGAQTAAAQVPSSLAADPTSSELMESGWDDDLDLEGLPDTPRAQEQSGPTHRKPDSVVPLNDVTQTQVDAAALDTANQALSPSNGWNDMDDVDTDADVDEAEIKQGLTNVVDHTPLPRPPPRFASNREVSVTSTATSLGATALSTAAVARQSSDASGWDNDGLDDLDNIVGDTDIDNAGKDIGDTSANTNGNVNTGVIGHAPARNLEVDVGAADDELFQDAMQGRQPPANGTGVSMIDQTPPPPPPQTLYQRQTTSSAVASASSSIFGDDSAAVSQSGSPIATTMKTQANVVDRTPERRTLKRMETSDAMAPDSGWGDDDDIDLNEFDDALTDERIDASASSSGQNPSQEGMSETVLKQDDNAWGGEHDTILNDLADDVAQIPLVDHTPPPPPPPTPTAARQTDATNDAVASCIESVWADDDDTLGNLDASIQLESNGDAGSAPKLVDHTPLPPPPPIKERMESTSSMAVFGADISVAETLDSIDEESYHKEQRRSALRSASGARKVVDHTPAPTARIVRGSAYESSWAAMGGASIGESLNSISEGEEDAPDSPHSKNVNGSDSGSSKKKEFMARHNNHKPRSAYTISFHEDSTVYPFGASSPPAVLSRLSEQSNENDPESMPVTLVPLKVPLVDHTPVQNEPRHTVNPSVDPIGGSSSEEELDVSNDGMDDTQENHFGKVVDHTPETPQAKKKASVGNTSASIMDDTVLGFADITDVDEDIRQNNDMDDFSHDDSTQVTGFGGTLDLDGENRSVVGTIKLSMVEENHLVDHVPRGDTKTAKRADASTFTLAGASHASSQNDDNVGDDDDTVPSGFGPIVDHTPGVIAPSAARLSTYSVATSVVTQLTGLHGDWKLDEELETVIDEVESTGMDARANGAWSNSNAETGTDTGSSAPTGKKEETLVDHVPEVKTKEQDGSVLALNPCDASTNNPDTIAGDTITNFGPVVDQTPIDNRSVAHSVAASMAPQATGLDADIRQSDEMEENTLAGMASVVESVWEAEDEPAIADGLNSTFAESHLVDHVPKTAPRKRGADASTIVIADPADVASTVDGFNDENVKSDRFGKMVDLTPAPRSASRSIATSMATFGAGATASARNEAKTEDDMDGTWFGTSTIGGDTAIGEGWDDEVTLEQLDAPAHPATTTSTDGDDAVDGSVVEKAKDSVVDHIPSRRDSVPTDSSVAVVVDPSVVSARKKEDKTDSIIENDNFGAVVDHTPIISHKTAASVATGQATATSAVNTEIKRDEEMDESTLNDGTQSAQQQEQEEGWEHEEAELENAGPRSAPEMPHLVDHVPQRPESRATDASTLDVVADPSEMLSQVDDFGQEEQNFGPVVDVTPVVRPPAVPSAAGSTVVAQPSMVDDDLDDAVETSGGDEPNAWDHDDLDIITEVPNPQSGNDEDRNREQLVDHLPEETEVPEPPQDASSEMATVGEKSALPPDDQKEDEFGPVVDHTPVPDPQAPATEPVAPPVQEEDRKPAADPTVRRPRTLDSVAAQLSTADTSKDTEDVEEDEFGPVVDHLPMQSSRSSLAPSRGGSTVDALATVSEVDDDSIGGGGSDDGMPTDTSVHANSLVGRATDHSTDERNLSVKWMDSLSENDAVVATSHGMGPSLSDEGEFYDAEMGDVSLNTTRYYDPNNTQGSGWNGSIVMDQDDTPPSTPKGRYSLDTNLLNDAELGLTPKTQGSSSSINPTTTTSTIDPACPGCPNNFDTGCPCVKSLIAMNAGEDKLVGKLKTPNGDVQIDFEKLLQQEILKRQLLEKEVQILRSSNDALKKSKTNMESKQGSHDEELASLQTSTKRSVEQLKNFETMVADLEKVNGELRHELEQKAKSELAWVAEKGALEASGKELFSEVESAKKQAVANSQLYAQDLQRIEAEMKSLQDTNIDLSAKTSELQSELSSVEAKHQELQSEMMRHQQEITNKDNMISDFRARQNGQTAEIENLKASLNDAMMQVTSEEQVKIQLQSLRATLTTKDAQHAEIKVHLDESQRKLALSQAEVVQNKRDTATVAKQHAQTVAKLHSQSTKDKARIIELLEAKKVTTNEAKKRISTIRTAEQTARAAKEQLEKEIVSIKQSHAQAIQAMEAKLMGATQQIETLEGKCKALETQNAEVRSKLSSVEADGQKLGSIYIELRSVSQERDTLRTELSVSRDMIGHLENQNKELMKMGSMLESSKREAESLRKQAESLRKASSAKDLHIGALTNQRAAITKERDGAKNAIADIKRRCATLEEAAERARQLATNDETKMMNLQQELERVSRELETNSKVGSTSQVEIETLSKRCVDLEGQLRAANARIGGFVALEQKLHNETKATQDAMKQKDNLAKSLDEAKQSIATLRGSMAQNQVVIEEKQRAIAQLQQDGEKWNSSITALQEEKQELQQRLAQAKEALQNRGNDEGSLAAALEETRSHLEALQVEAQGLADAKEQADRDNEALQAESEEMLVQFGMLKEQMDAGEQHIIELQHEIEERNAAIIELEHAKAETHPGGTVPDEEVEALRQANLGLQAELEQATQECNELRMQFKHVGQSQATLDGTVEGLRRDLADLEEGKVASENQMVAEMQRLASERQALEDRYASLSRQLDQATAQLQNQNTQMGRTSDLQNRIGFLERSLADQQAAVEQKDAAILDLQTQLSNVMRGSQGGAETIDALHHTINDMTAAAEMGRARIRELEVLCESSRNDLEATKFKLSETESSLFDLQMDFDSKRRDEIEEGLQALKSELRQKESTLAAMQQDNTSLQQHLTALQDELCTTKERVADRNALEESKSQAMEQMRVLESKIVDLMHQKAIAESESSTRESGVRRELTAAHDAVSERDEQMKLLQSQVAGMEQQLREVEEEIGKKDSDLYTLATEFEQLRSQNEELSAEVALHDGNDRELMAQMKQDIIKLAMALEQAEILRADALDQLEHETKTHATGLRHWANHVKRLYSDMNCGNT